MDPRKERILVEFSDIFPREIIREPTLSPEAKMVFIYLLNRILDGQLDKLDPISIAPEIGSSPKTVKRCLKELKSFKLRVLLSTEKGEDHGKP